MTIKEIKTLFALPIKETNTLVSFVIKKTLEFIVMHNDFELSNYQLIKFKKLAKRRIAGEPIAYLLGHQEFYGLDFLVNKHTLIPRPETELLINKALETFKKNQEGIQVVLDVGTGSGCIAITLATKLNTEIIAVDISKEALKIAKKNAKLNHIDRLINFKHGNLLEPILSDLNHQTPTTNYVICANLPYLTPLQVKNSPTIQYEPKTALISGNDGLRHYQELFEQLTKLKAKKITLLCEIDDTQEIGMSKLIKQKIPNSKFEILKDLSGYDRLAVITIENE